MARNNKQQDDQNYEDCPPRAEALIYSLRAFGYDIAMAIADLIDNSIFAEATNIWIDYGWNDGNPWVSILDDGVGMTEKRLVEAMRLGSISPLETRQPEDLGRFGLGLKTASFSQCKLVTVITKTKSGSEATRFWDLEYVKHSKSWKLGKSPPGETRELLKPLIPLPRGTLVLWQNMDRFLSQDKESGHDQEAFFLGRFLDIKQYLEMVFHQYLEDKKRPLSIHVGKGICEPWDPYLKSNSFTQELSSEKYQDKRVSVIPYVLPHVSKRNEAENIQGGGIKGWNSQQGFYIYRNRRMIVSGGYLDFDLKEEPHYSLARIQVNITNDMDHEWSIDVRKAVASPPDHLRAELLRIARATRQHAVEVYRTRTGIARKRGAGDTTRDVWLRRQIGDKITYRLNIHNPVLVRIIDELKPNKKWINKLFHVIENTVPHRLIILDGWQNKEDNIDMPAEFTSPPKELIEYCIEMYSEQRDRGRTHEEAVDIVCSIQPFDSHPGYRAYLDTKDG